MPIESSKVAELPGLRASVDRVVYRPDAETPPERPHCFVYFITIHNDSDQQVTVRGRKWVVTDDQGDLTVVEGAGVVRQFPVIPPGEVFSYHSFHLLSTMGAVAEGSYFCVNKAGSPFLIRIPPFEMRVSC